MELILYTADCRGMVGNCLYPHRRVITNAAGVAEAGRYDQVFARYRGDYRNMENFIESCVIPQDVDNDCDDPGTWRTAEDLEAEFADVDYVIVPSRHHMRPKGGKSARPRYHMLFPSRSYTDAAEYTAVKTAVLRKYPFFDEKTKDAARFFFGSDFSAGDVVWHEGAHRIDETLTEAELCAPTAEKTEPSYAGGPIPEGSRNSTLSRFAGRVLKRYGVCDKAHQVFLQRAAQCDPPLEDSELSTIWGSAVRFAEKVQCQDGYIPPERYNAEPETEGLKPEDYSDLGEAKVLAREFGGELRYTAATDLLRFDGRCWQEDKQLALGACLDFMDLQLQDARDAVQEAEDSLIAAGIPMDEVKDRGRELKRDCAHADLMGLYFALMGADAYLRFVMKYRNYRSIVNVQNTVKPMVALDVSALDADPNLLNTPQATYDLARGIDGGRPHEPGDLITRMTSVSPGETGREIWEQALDTFFCGDRELIEYVQLNCGMAAIGRVYREQLIIAYGGGANGKSTFWNTIFRVLGTYAGKISADTLTVNCRHNTRPEAAELKGKRLIIASETEEGVRLNTSMVKQLCSTDEIQAEKKYKDPFHFVPSHTLVLYTNHLPKVGANDDGVWRRLIVIPFQAVISGTSDIKNYADYLFTHAGPYIMTWIIQGAQKAIEADFRTEQPQVVREAIDRYRDANDWLGLFLGEHCELDPSYEEKSGELYRQYRFVCTANGEYVRSTTDFYGALEQAGYRRRRSNRGSCVCGLRLKSGQDFIG